MHDNKVTIVGLLFLVLCLGLVGGVYYVDGQLKELREQYDELEQRKVNLEQDRTGLRDQIAVFKNAFSILEGYNVRAASSEMDFYAQVQSKIQESNDVSIISQRQGGVAASGRSSITLALRGNYYSLMKVLAGWRALPVTVRVSSLSLSIPRGTQGTDMGGEIQADVTVEAIVAADSAQAPRR